MMAPKISSIPQKPIDVPTPLSLAQQRLWFLYQFNPQSPDYNSSRAWRFTGPLNTRVLQASLNAVVARHEALRTTFQDIDGQPIQVIQPTLTVPFEKKDWSTYASAQLDAEIERFLLNEPLQPFNLLTGPLFRFTLLQCRPDEHVFVFTVHHIVFDGTSLINFCEELSCYYAATLTEQPNPIAPLPIQYQDYAFWQQDQVTDEKLASQLAYWKQQLQGVPLVLELPSESARPKTHSGLRRYQTFALAPSVISKLKQLIQPQGITVFMALLAAFYILLFRYTGQRDILVGTPIAGRTHTDLEKLIGFLVNTLVLRTQIVDRPTFQDVLKQVRKTCLEAYRHQDLPFEKLVENLNPVRDSNRSPVVQAIFQLRQLSDRCLTFPDVIAHPLPVTKTIGSFDLHMVCEETESGIDGFVYYPQTIYSDAFMATFSKHYQTLLKELITNPDQPVNQISFLTEPEIHQQIVAWNNTESGFPLESNLPALFEEQVIRTPNAIAVVYEEEQLTYAQLNQCANQLAHYLQRKGVGPEMRVGVCLERSVDLVVSLLGILKAGGAYVPLGPDYPPDRLAYMLGDAQPAVVLTHEPFLSTLSSYEGVIVCLDISGPQITQESTASPSRAVTPDNLAYVMYTSGSTGRPKGVGVVHQGVVRLVQGPNYVDFTADEVMLQFAPVTFDASTFEIWGALLHGGRLVLCAEQTPSLNEFSQFIQRTGITTLWLTASLFHQMTEHAAEAFHQVRQLLTGGDVVSVEYAKQFCVQHPTVQLINGYGPTENTTFSCCHEINPIDSTVRSLPIGRPISQTQVYVLSAYLVPVPIGVQGELYLGGLGLARGYWNQPELTASRFLPNPFAPQGRERFYRTGDWGRYGSNGLIEFLGRRDQQIKLRGFRIELGEIEAVLHQQANVKDAVVVLREDNPSNPQLVAYVVPTLGAPLEPSTLRIALKAQLPDYMVPTNYVLLEAWPLTPNGKIDRQALPAPDATHGSVADVYEPPQTQLEELLMGMWQDLLQLERVGRHDDFFQLGGHSLLATQVMTRLRSQLHTELSLRTLFEQPTIAELARSVDKAQSIAMSNAIPEEDLANLIYDLDSMSEEEAQALLEKEQQRPSISTSSPE